MRFAGVQIGICVAALFFALAACGGTEPGATATVAPVEATLRATPTAEPGGSSVPSPSASEQGGDNSGEAASVVLADASDRQGLWAGAVPDAHQYAIPWIALRFVPGADPDVDPWRVGGGRFGIPELKCEPTTVEGGWSLGACTDTRGNTLRGMELSAFVPEVGNSGLDVTLEQGRFTSNATLSKVLQTDEPQSSENVTLLWHEKAAETPNTDIWVDDGIVYAPHVESRIALLDAETGERISFASILGVKGRGVAAIYDVKAKDGFLYAATVSNGLVIFDVSDPENPEQVGQHYVYEVRGSPENFTNVHNIYLAPDEPLVYTINQSFPVSDLRVIDVSDPSAPKEVGRFAIEDGMTHDVHVIRHDGKLVAFLNYLHAGLWILDVTDPAAIETIATIDWEGAFSHGGWAFEADGGLYYAHTSEGYDKSLAILDVSDLSDPRVVSNFKTRDGISIHNVEVVDGYGYISYYLDGLRVVDLRDPRRPVEVAHYDTVAAEDEADILQGAWGVKVYDGTVYVSDIESGIYAFSVVLP